ncbi:hypothetical protein VP01_7330g3 [Puccinia sorghi]|uniref:Uncharacterized protein n=1 Tax=Puccinia sorghi TaxID=27349 RepID=A0A0L6UF21_9BASI|nr:hypothetical protein VP01_7330g3 [Puccinia sorghi]
MTALLKLQGVLTSINNTAVALGDSDNAELTMLLLEKMDSVTHNNVITADNSESAQKIWLSIKERIASSQASNCAQMFNDLLYVKFQEDSVKTFVTDIKVAIKKLAEVKESTSTATKAALYLSKGKNTNKYNGKKRNGNQSINSKLCRSGYHNQKQDVNHSSDNCWHLHPDKAPDWWKESQAQWKAGKEKEKENYYLLLLTLWEEEWH